MRIFIWVFFLALISAHSEEPRTWFTTKGSNFSATYTGFKEGKVGLKNEAGKNISFSVKGLSIVDRYYLHSTHEIPIKDLEGGEIHNVEDNFTLKSSQFKVGKPFQVSGEGYKVKLNSLITPHFIIYYDPILKVNEMGKMLEKIWFSHAFRTSKFIELYGEKRRVYLYLPKGEQLTALGQYYLDTEMSKGEISEREIKGIIQKWGYTFYRSEIQIPEKLVKLYNSESSTKIQKVDSAVPYMESLLLSAPFFKWQEMFLPGEKLPQNRFSSSDKRVVSAQGFLAMVFASEMRLNSNENRTDLKVVERCLSIKIPPQGKPKKWGKELISAINDKKCSGRLDVIYDISAFKKKTGGKAESLINTQLIMAIGRFLQKDLEHMIHYCALSDDIAENSDFPSKKRLSEIYNYSSPSEMDEALLEFILKENRSL